jgi:predicted  nucleic acid-binding Zn-ribbon protein
MDHQTMPMLDLNWEYLRWNALRSTRRKLFYVATPKVACTSLKWWFARLEGYSGILRASSEESKETSPELVIHDSFHKVAPQVAGLPPEQLAEAIQSDEYFRFALVRNPFKRIFSAWQSKLLLREPLQVAPYLDKAFYHHDISSKADITKAFESFLEHLAGEEAPTYWDVHWTPQVDLLRPDVIRYTSLSQIEDVSELEKLLADWLGDKVASPFVNRLANESLIPYQEEFISDRSAQLIRALYSADFEQFGYKLDLPKAKESFSSEEFELALKAIDMIRARHERIGVMRGAAERQIRDLQIRDVSKEENLNTLRHVVADAVNQYARLQRESMDTLSAKLNEFQSASHQMEHRVMDAVARIESLNELSEVSRVRFEREKAALEANLAGLQSDCVEKDRDRAMLRAELERVVLYIRHLREEIAQSQSKVASVAAPSSEAIPADLWRELEGLRGQIEPLKEMPETLNRTALQCNSLRFLIRQIFSVLGRRLIGRRIDSET